MPTINLIINREVSGNYCLCAVRCSASHKFKNMNDNIKRLQEQIEAEKRKISKCNHDFDKPFYNAETVIEAYGYRMVAQGSDVWHEPEGYRDVKKDRWTRKCKICGFEQHTYSQKPIVSGHEPSF